MRKKIIVILLITIFSHSVVLSQQVQSKEIVTILSGTPIQVRTVEDIHSSELQVGENIFLVVDQDVVVDGNVVINQGARVVAEVMEAKDKNFAGIPGKIRISFKHVSAIDEQEIFLSGSKIREGESKMVLSIVLGVALCPLFLLMKGKEGVIRAGQTIGVYTAHKAAIKVRK